MNTETGELKYFDTDEALMEALKNERFVPVDLDDITPKQKADMQVSKHDNKSKLGNKFTSARAKRKCVAKQIYKQNH